jgi:hypothetical protein
MNGIPHIEDHEETLFLKEKADKVRIVEREEQKKQSRLISKLILVQDAVPPKKKLSLMRLRLFLSKGRN